MWPNAIETAFQRFGQNPDTFPTFLEIIRMLPEEIFMTATECCKPATVPDT